MTGLVDVRRCEASMMCLSALSTVHGAVASWLTNGPCRSVATHSHIPQLYVVCGMYIAGDNSAAVLARISFLFCALHRLKRASKIVFLIPFYLHLAVFASSQFAALNQTMKAHPESRTNKYRPDLYSLCEDRSQDKM